jgi:hypothetical protein
MNRLTELRQRARLAWAVLRGRDGNLIHHTEVELRAAHYFDGDKMSALAASNMLDLVRVFSGQGHSGFSASFVRQAFTNLADYQPLGPLTGSDSEWVEVGEGISQNRRCPRLVKEPGRFYGQPNDVEAIVFEDPDGSRFTCYSSARPVSFPYLPRETVVKLPPDAPAEVMEQLALQAWAEAQVA